MTMSIQEALRIQADQLRWYGRHMTPVSRRELYRRVHAENRLPAYTSEAWRVNQPVGRINEWVPRGAEIEYAAGF